MITTAKPAPQPSDPSCGGFTLRGNANSPKPTEQTHAFALVQTRALREACRCMHQIQNCSNQLAILRVIAKHSLPLTQRHQLELLADQLLGLLRWHNGLRRRAIVPDPDSYIGSSGLYLVSRRMCVDFEHRFALLLTQLEQALLDSLVRLDQGHHLGEEWVRILDVQRALPDVGFAMG